MQSSQLLKKVRQIEISAGRLVSETFAGKYHSVFKGQGMEFAEARHYVPGDDVRRIDWNISARLGEIFIKEYREERQLTLMLVCDVSASKYFGSTTKFKQEIMAELSALFAFSALKNYDKVIVLHNEYVSKIMFDAITAHKNIVFLYPNSLYGEIELNDSNNKITLVRGHGYPSSDIKNGFNWENENTNPYEFDSGCNSWEFYPISNGHMLNCYPEQIIWQDELLLKTLKEL